MELSIFTIKYSYASSVLVKISWKELLLIEYGIIKGKKAD